MAGSPGKGGGGRPAVPSGAFAGSLPTMQSSLGSAALGVQQADPTANAALTGTMYNPGYSAQPYQPTLQQGSLQQGSLGQMQPSLGSSGLYQTALGQVSPSVAAPTPRPPLPMVQPSLGSQQMPYMPPSLPTPSPQMPIPRPQMPAPGTPTQNPQLPTGLMAQLQNFNFGGF